MDRGAGVETLAAAPSVALRRDRFANGGIASRIRGANAGGFAGVCRTARIEGVGVGHGPCNGRPAQVDADRSRQSKTWRYFGDGDDGRETRLESSAGSPTGEGRADRFRPGNYAVRTADG